LPALAGVALELAPAGDVWPPAQNRIDQVTLGLIAPERTHPKAEAIQRQSTFTIAWPMLPARQRAWQDPVAVAGSPKRYNGVDPS